VDGFIENVTQLLITELTVWVANIRRVPSASACCPPRLLSRTVPYPTAVYREDLAALLESAAPDASADGSEASARRSPAVASQFVL
jgi:hypothetical protein